MAETKEEEVKKTEAEVQQEKTRKLISSIAVIVCGVITIIAGCLIPGGADKEKVSPAAITLITDGSRQATDGILELYPEAEPAISATAEILHAAVITRRANPELMQRTIEDQLTVCDVPVKVITPIVNLVVAQLNNAYAKTETEENYLVHVQAIANGMAASAESFRNKKKAEDEKKEADAVWFLLPKFSPATSITLLTAGNYGIMMTSCY